MKQHGFFLICCYGRMFCACVHVCIHTQSPAERLYKCCMTVFWCKWQHVFFRDVQRVTCFRTVCRMLLCCAHWRSVCTTQCPDDACVYVYIHTFCVQYTYTHTCMYIHKYIHNACMYVFVRQCTCAFSHLRILLQYSFVQM
jgi:hypothetical protein